MTGGEPRRGRAGSVVFFHAHPDDEAIFTGGTMARLAQSGWRVVLVLATRGELGEPVPGGPDAGRVAAHRVAETEAAGLILGVSRVEFLGYGDSGMAGDPANHAPGSFLSAPLEEAATALAAVLVQEAPAALVTYDAGGIYGHPDHVKVHEVGARAAALAGVATVYEATVDREYLHFVETHLVVEVGAASGLGLAGSTVGVPTVEVDVTVDVRPVLDRKRAAMSAHASQIPETASAMRLPGAAFAAVYGFEWFLRRGLPGPVDPLA